MTPVTFRDMSLRVHPRVSSVLTAAVLTLVATCAAAQDTTGAPLTAYAQC